MTRPPSTSLSSKHLTGDTGGALTGAWRTGGGFSRRSDSHTHTGEPSHPPHFLFELYDGRTPPPPFGGGMMTHQRERERREAVEASGGGGCLSTTAMADGGAVSDDAKNSGDGGVVPHDRLGLRFSSVSAFHFPHLLSFQICKDRQMFPAGATTMMMMMMTASVKATGWL
ncbi:hypothetical protein HanPI659440_Chr09g0326441 [Helianthus annuus]|nr:hypothetical protein HanPI659440_Chr09g0326441 [Helianthus annuus]